MNFLVVVQKLVVLFKIEAVHIQKSHSLSKHHQLEYQCYTSGGYYYCFFLTKMSASSFSHNLSKH